MTVAQIQESEMTHAIHARTISTRWRIALAAAATILALQPALGR